MERRSFRCVIVDALEGFAKCCEGWGEWLDEKSAQFQERIDEWEKRMNAKIDSWGEPKAGQEVKLVLMLFALVGIFGCDQTDHWKDEAVSTPQIPLLTERIQFNEIRSAFKDKDDSPEAYMRVVVPRPILCNELAAQQEKVEEWIAGMLTANKYPCERMRKALGLRFSRKSFSGRASPGGWRSLRLTSQLIQWRRCR